MLEDKNACESRTMSNIVAINSSHNDISSQRKFFVGKYEMVDNITSYYIAEILFKYLHVASFHSNRG
jgi:hypothetical protein